MNTVKEFEYKGCSIKIVQDEDAQSPQDWEDKALFLIGGHRDFYVPEPGEKRLSDWGTIRERYKATHWIFHLEAYIHSGVRLALSNCGNFPDRQWDVSQVGAVFVAKKEWRLSRKAREAAQSHIDTWNQYLSGDVYGYVINDDQPDEESCWGFYGLEYCEQEAKSMADCMAKRETTTK